MELGLKITLNGGKCYYNPLAKAFHIRGGGRNQYKIDETSQSAYFGVNGAIELQKIYRKY